MEILSSPNSSHSSRNGLSWGFLCKGAVGRSRRWLRGLGASIPRTTCFSCVGSIRKLFVWIGLFAKKIIRFPFEGNGLFNDRLKYFVRAFSAGYLPPCCKIQIRYYIFFYGFAPRICHCFQLRRYAFQTLLCQGF